MFTFGVPCSLDSVQCTILFIYSIVHVRVQIHVHNTHVPIQKSIQVDLLIILKNLNFLKTKFDI